MILSLYLNDEEAELLEFMFENTDEPDILSVEDLVNGLLRDLLGRIRSDLAVEVLS